MLSRLVALRESSEYSKVVYLVGYSVLNSND